MKDKILTASEIQKSWVEFVKTKRFKMFVCKCEELSDIIVKPTIDNAVKIARKYDKKTSR